MSVVSGNESQDHRKQGGIAGQSTRGGEHLIPPPLSLSSIEGISGYISGVVRGIWLWELIG